MTLLARVLCHSFKAARITIVESPSMRKATNLEDFVMSMPCSRAYNLAALFVLNHIFP